MELTHFNEQGRARMVDVTEKAVTFRTAVAAGRVRMNAETLRCIREGGVQKGDVLAVAQTAGIMAAKRTSELIPMCHPIALTGVNIALLTIYDMCKAVDKSMEMGNIYLEHKSGGKSGEFINPRKQGC